MKNASSFIRNPYDEKDRSACGIIGVINSDGMRFSGELVLHAIANMHERGNGLGGGFAAYGIYPDWPDHYCLHVMFDHKDDVPEVEQFLQQRFQIDYAEPIPLHPTPAITEHPHFMRYFALPKCPDDEQTRKRILSDDDEVVRCVMQLNMTFEHAFVISCGKNMGVFKGVGFPEDIAELFGIENYSGYLWTAHNRFPTNSPGWWGGAHPFTLLDWSIVHNGEISSYGTNLRYLQMFGYECTLQTDTEVVAYLMDLLVRRHGLSFEDACSVLAPPFWKDIDAMPPRQREHFTELRRIYASAALNGPFAFLLAFSGGLIGLNDRVKLRPLVVATKGPTTYMSSEESAIRSICPNPERVWAPTAGQPVIARCQRLPARQVEVA